MGTAHGEATLREQTFVYTIILVLFRVHTRALKTTGAEYEKNRAQQTNRFSSAR